MLKIEIGVRITDLTRIKHLIITVLSVMSLVSCTNHHSAETKDDSTHLNSIASDSSLVWTDYKTGELPPVTQYTAFDSIIKQWNINYKRIEGGCDPASSEAHNYEQNNLKYFKYLESKYGKNWRSNFDKEVGVLEKRLQKSQQSEEVKCIDKGGNMEQGFETECTYPNKHLSQAWSYFSTKNKDNENGMFLSPILPVTNTVVNIDTTINESHYLLTVHYAVTKKSVMATLEFPGGVTTIKFISDGQNTKSTTINSPD